MTIATAPETTDQVWIVQVYELGRAPSAPKVFRTWRDAVRHVYRRWGPLAQFTPVVRDQPASWFRQDHVGSGILLSKGYVQ